MLSSCLNENCFPVPWFAPMLQDPLQVCFSMSAFYPNQSCQGPNIFHTKFKFLEAEFIYGAGVV